jgi:hypothetical protein
MGQRQDNLERGSLRAEQPMVIPWRVPHAPFGDRRNARKGVGGAPILESHLRDVLDPPERVLACQALTQQSRSGPVPLGGNAWRDSAQLRIR